MRLELMNNLRNLALITLVSVAASSNAISIAEAKLLPVGTEVTIDDCVIVSKDDLINSVNSKNFQVRDTFNGMAWENQQSATCFGSNAVIDAMLAGANPGDHLSIHGITATFNGLFELTSDAVVTLTRNSLTPGTFFAPVNIRTGALLDFAPTGEQLESNLVRLNGVTFSSTGTFGVGNFTATDGTNNTIVRVSVSTMDLNGTAIPTGTVDLVGVVGQFSTTAPFLTTYQLNLRSLADIIPVNTNRVYGVINAEHSDWMMAYDSTPISSSVDVEIRDENNNFVMATTGSWSPSTGEFYANVPASVTSSYRISTKFGVWLRATYPEAGMPGLAPGSNYQFTASVMTGDIDGDNEVGPGDFGAFSSAYGSVNGDGNWNSNADLDADGEVGPSDFGIFSTNYGATGAE